MRGGLFASIILHVIAIGVLFVNFSGSHETETPPPPSVAVQVMTPAEFSERMAGKEDAKPKPPAPPAEVKAPETPQAAPKEAEEKPVQKPAEQIALPPPPKNKEAPVKRAEDVQAAKAEPKKPEPKKEEPEKAPEEAEPDRQEAAKPKPEPKRELAPQTAELPEPRPQTRPEPKREPKPEPARERNFDPNRIAALLRKGEPADENAAPPPAPDLNAPPSKTYEERMAALLNRDPNAGQRAGAAEREPWRPASSLQDQAQGMRQDQGQQNASSCTDAVISRIEQNWDLPLVNVSGDAVIRLRIELKRDGSLARAPLILDGQGGRAPQAAVDAAIRAAIRGQPYPITPDQYDRCRVVTLVFNPREMYGGYGGYGG